MLQALLLETPRSASSTDSLDAKSRCNMDAMTWLGFLQLLVHGRISGLWFGVSPNQESAGKHAITVLSENLHSESDEGATRPASSYRPFLNAQKWLELEASSEATCSPVLHFTVSQLACGWMQGDPKKLNEGPIHCEGSGAVKSQGGLEILKSFRWRFGLGGMEVDMNYSIMTHIATSGRPRSSGKDLTFRLQNSLIFNSSF